MYHINKSQEILPLNCPTVLISSEKLPCRLSSPVAINNILTNTTYAISDSSTQNNSPGVLTIYMWNRLVENLMHKHFKMFILPQDQISCWSSGRITHYKVYQYQLDWPEKVYKIILYGLKIMTAYIFWHFPNRMAQTSWFSNRNFQVSPCNGKKPGSPVHFIKSQVCFCVLSTVL